MRSQTAGISAYFAAIALSGLLVGGGLVWARAETRRIVDARGKARMETLLAEGILPVYREARLPPLEDPFAAAWDGAPAIEVPLSPQAITMPMLETASVGTVLVQAFTDGEGIAWRLRWRDEAPDQNVDVARFTDAVAIQFPLAAGAPFTMGDRGKRVQVLHWKGLWQKDLDEHFQDVQDLHPNYWTDLYWFARGSFPFPVPSAFGDTLSHAWLVAYRAGNSVADIHRAEPVEELSAEGFGTLTPHRDAVTRGRGVWKEGWWSVVFARPLRTEDPLDYQFRPGGKGTLGVAVWEGASGNVGGRKHYTNWIPFEVQS